MISTLYRAIALIDTSAAIALHDPTERRHAAVRSVYANARDLRWAVLDLTSHECFTRVRYAREFQPALEHYQFLRGMGIQLVRFVHDDEPEALRLLQKYADHRFSFHDALCAAAMLRSGIYKILTLDSDFATLGFEVLPATVH